jgi:hypothetical protein
MERESVPSLSSGLDWMCETKEAFKVVACREVANSIKYSGVPTMVRNIPLMLSSSSS